MQFLGEVYIDGVQFELQELDKVLIAASAVIPVFGFKEWHYTNLSGILLLRTFRITCIVSTCTSEGDIVLLTMSKVRGCHLQESTLALTKAH